MRILDYIKNKFNKDITIKLSDYEYEKYFNGNEYDKEFVKLLLDKYYKNLKNIFEQRNNTINIEFEDSVLFIVDSVYDFIVNNEYLVNNGFLNKKEIKRFNYLKGLISYDKGIEYIKDDSFLYYYEQEYKLFNTSIVFNYLLLDHDKFKDILNEELIIIILTFIKKYTIDNFYLYPENMIKNIKYMNNYSSEYNVLDKIFLKEKPEFIKQAKLNKNFKNKIIKNISKDFNNFEKSFYIYIKLCSMLSHDEAELSKVKNYIIDHYNINRIEEVDDKNNLIVCYEFATIFALFLDIFNINYEVVGDCKFGSRHLSINVLDGDALVNFEATNGIFDSDLTKIKNHIEACGVNIVKANPREMDNIYRSIEKVYKYLSEEEYENYYLESDIIKQFRKRIDNLKSLNDDKKLEIFMEEVRNSPYINIVDTIKYMYLWRKVLFKNSDIFNINEIVLKTNIDSVVTIISFKKDNDYVYYLYFKSSFELISKQEIIDNFKNNIFEYTHLNSFIIPGLESKEEKNKRLEMRRKLFGE